MTVAELIERLYALDPALSVVVSGAGPDEGGGVDCESVQRAVRLIADGSYEPVRVGGRGPTVQVVLLGGRSRHAG